MADRFFTPQPLSLGEITLDGDEAKHLAAVRRFGPGDHVVLFNGDGNEFHSTVREVNKRSVQITIDSIHSPKRERSLPLTIAAAMPKGDRFDFMLEKLVELGVSTFIPLITHRSVVIPKTDKRDKWERAVIEASKQCGRNHLMKVQDPLDWNALMHEPTHPSSRFVLHTSPKLLAMHSVNESLIIAVGPEGGFTESEIELATANGWHVRSLGNRILRMETAAITAAALTMN